MTRTETPPSSPYFVLVHQGCSSHGASCRVVLGARPGPDWPGLSSQVPGTVSRSIRATVHPFARVSAELTGLAPLAQAALQFFVLRDTRDPGYVITGVAAAGRHVIINDYPAPVCVYVRGFSELGVG